MYKDQIKSRKTKDPSQEADIEEHEVGSKAEPNEKLHDQRTVQPSRRKHFTETKFTTERNQKLHKRSKNCTEPKKKLHNHK